MCSRFVFGRGLIASFGEVGWPVMAGSDTRAK